MVSEYDKLAFGGGSSNGRTADSGSVSRGSSPLPPASKCGGHSTATFINNNLKKISKYKIV